MVNASTTGPPGGQTNSDYERQLREINESLLVSSIRQQELAEQAQMAEAGMRESEERYRTLFELGPVAVYSCDVSGVIREFNRRAAELWGRAALGDTDEWFCGSFKMIRPDGSVLAHEQCPMAEVLSGAIPHARDAEVSIERPDGSRITVVVNIRPLKNEQGKITGAINCFYDITARKLAEEATAWLAAIVTSSEDAIISKNVDGIITSWNRGAEHLFGYAAEEVIGKSVALLIPQDHLDEEPQILERIRRGEPVEHYETVRRRKDGTLLDISLTISPIRDSAGRIIGASKIARDITERRRLEQQTREQAAELSDLHRRKDEFLAMLGHELRNPLAPLANAVQLLRLEKNPGAIQEQARMIIERQVGQLSRLVEELLEVSRISTGRIHLQEERLDFRGVIERAVETVRPLIAQRQHALSLSLSKTPIWVLADASRLEQVVVNLLTNAVKYTDVAGQIWLGLAAAGEEEAVLRVRDNGVGIAPELLPRVFDLFTQADQSLERAQGGLGVGLALVHQIVMLHHGRVEANSVVGQGSEFIVRLPLSPPPVPKAGSLAKAPSTAFPRRVLVVDDNVDMAYSLSTLLISAGHDVRIANDGPAALVEAIAFHPEAVFMDIGLAGMDGYEVAQRLRMEPGFENTLLVAATGYGQQSDRSQSRDAGFNYHLVKPIDFAKVCDVLDTIGEQGPAD